MFRSVPIFLFSIIGLILALTCSTCNKADEPQQILGNAPVPLPIDSSLHSCILQFEDYIEQHLVETPVPGVAIAIVTDSVIAYQKGFGLKTVGTKDSVDVNSVFRLASLSKGFAGILTGLLVQDGCLDWDDRVIDYVPNLKLKSRKHTRKLTIRHLLSHTSGLPRHTYSNLLNMDVDYEKIKKMLPEVEIAHPIGTQYNYQNVIFSLIGDVILKATGKTYEQQLDERIFKPLNMWSSSASYAGIKAAENIAFPHTRRDSSHSKLPLSKKYYSVAPAAGVNASVSDMANWLLFLLGNEPDIIQDSTLNTVFHPQADVHRGERGVRNWRGLDDAFYGMGWRILDYRGKRIAYHGGYVSGYRGEIALIPEEKIGIVFLSNGVSKVAHDCLPYFFDLYLSNIKS